MLATSQGGMNGSGISLDLIVENSECLVVWFTNDGGEVGILKKSFPVVRDGSLAAHEQAKGRKSLTYVNRNVE